MAGSSVLGMPGELEEIRDRLREFAAARDWDQFHTPRNLALALCGEAGELAAELQWVPDEGVAEHLLDPAAFARLADEVADVMIYLVRFADVSGIDVMSAVRAKIERNETRFPSLLERFRLTPSERQQGGQVVSVGVGVWARGVPRDAV